MSAIQLHKFGYLLWRGKMAVDERKENKEEELWKAAASHGPVLEMLKTPRHPSIPYSIRYIPTPCQQILDTTTLSHLHCFSESLFCHPEYVRIQECRPNLEQQASSSVFLAFHGKLDAPWWCSSKKFLRSAS